MAQAGVNPHTAADLLRQAMAQKYVYHFYPRSERPSIVIQLLAIEIKSQFDRVSVKSISISIF